jgi:hypothetical protein
MEHKTVKSYDFVQNVDELYVYRLLDSEKVSFLVLYVDDILLIGNNIGILHLLRFGYLINSI